MVVICVYLVQQSVLSFCDLFVGEISAEDFMTSLFCIPMNGAEVQKHA